MKVKEKSEKARLKLNIQKTKIITSNPVTSWQVDGEKMETVRLYFLGLQNHCRGWLQPWNRKILAPWKNSYNLDSLLKKQRHLCCLVKAVVFPVVMYGCENWIIKKNWWSAEKLMLSKCGAREDSWQSVPWTVRRSNQSILKKINPEYSLEGLMLKLQYSDHLIQRVNSLEKTLILEKIECKRRRGRQRMRWLDSITDSRDTNLSQLWEIVKDRQTWRAAVHGVTESWTWLKNWTITTKTLTLLKKTSVQNGSPSGLLRVVLSRLIEKLPPKFSPKNFYRIKHNSQLLGCKYFLSPLGKYGNRELCGRMQVSLMLKVFHVCLFVCLFCFVFEVETLKDKTLSSPRKKKKYCF